MSVFWGIAMFGKPEPGLPLSTVPHQHDDYAEWKKCPSCQEYEREISDRVARERSVRLAFIRARDEIFASAVFDHDLEPKSRKLRTLEQEYELQRKQILGV